jgi:hypothetical protein
MNVEIGAEAALFPEKEYITELPLQCACNQYYTHADPDPAFNVSAGLGSRS